MLSDVPHRLKTPVKINTVTFPLALQGDNNHADIPSGQYETGSLRTRIGSFRAFIRLY